MLTERGFVSDDQAVTLCEIEFALAWNVRGHSTRPAFVSEAERLLDLPLPLQPNTAARGAVAASLWLGPTSWLFVAGQQGTKSDFDAGRKTLNEAGGALFDVSAAYGAWSISGPASARVLNRGCPLDFDPRVFRAGCCAQSVFGHINALLYKPDDRPLFFIIVARSLATDAWASLCASATTDGYRVVPALPLDRVLHPA